PPPRRPNTGPTTGPSSDELAPHVEAPKSSSPVASASDKVVHLSAMESGEGQQSFTGFRESNPGQGARVIRIPYAALKRGELRYNIPIHPHDVIYVEPPELGFYFVGRHVVRGGSFQL